MKKIFLIITLLAVLTNTAAAKKRWDYTMKDHERLSYDQVEVLTKAIEVGKKENLSLTLALIAGVESRYGLLRSSNGRYCGPMQIDRTQYGVTCKQLRDDIGLSMRLAAKHFKMYLKRYNNDYEKALVAYNGGNARKRADGSWVNKHGNEYLRRVVAVYRVLH